MKNFLERVFAAMFIAIILFTLSTLPVLAAGTPDAGEAVAWMNLFLLVLGASVPIVLLIIKFVKLTAWGKANEKALDEIADAIGKAKAMGGTVTNVMDNLTAKESSLPPEVVGAWKAARDRRDPKRGAKSYKGKRSEKGPDLNRPVTP